MIMCMELISEFFLNILTKISIPSTLLKDGSATTGPVGHSTGSPTGSTTGPPTGTPIGPTTGPRTGYLTGPSTGTSTVFQTYPFSLNYSSFYIKRTSKERLRPVN